MFEVLFEQGADSQTVVDPLTARIDSVTGERTPASVAVENGAPGRAQRAHVTANIVHVAAMERLITGETWFGAWKAMRKVWQFSRGLLDSWYADPQLQVKARVSLKNDMYHTLGNADAFVAEKLARNGVPLETCWFVRPLAGTDKERREGRLYFDHDPVPSEYDPAVYEAPSRWKPDLDTKNTAALAQHMADWVDFRGLFPWTSVDAESYQTGESQAVTDLDELVADREDDDALSADDRKKMAKYMLATFDFFPPTLNNSRTIYHAAGVAARHVVENFCYCPAIKPAWRDRLAQEFATAWLARVADTVRPKKSSRTDSRATAKTDRNLDGLTELQSSWTDVKNAYDGYYAVFRGSLPA